MIRWGNEVGEEGRVGEKTYPKKVESFRNGELQEFPENRCAGSPAKYRGSVVRKDGLATAQASVPVEGAW